MGPGTNAAQGEFLADREGCNPRKLLDSDYLLGVYDETHMETIRFLREDGGHVLVK